MRTLWQDVRYGIRMLRKSPGFTAIARMTLAIGIGANTVMFSISDAMLLLRARKVKDPERLACCATQGVDDSSFRYSEYLTLRDSGLAFSDVMAQIDFHDRGTLIRGGSAWDVWTTYVSANFFSILGAAPVPGRGFLPEEDRHGSAPVVVLSYRCWQRLGSNPKLIGMVIREGLLLTTVSLIIGLALRLAVARVEARMLYGISPIDPVSIVVTVALLGAASLLASYLPARRAAKVDPMAALQYE